MTTTLINGAPIDDTGKLLVTTATPLPTWPFLGGWAYDPVTMALAVKDAVPAANDPWNNGIRNTALGQVYVITTQPSPVFYVHGLAISGDGRLFMSSGAPIGSAPGGWPIAGDGGIAGSGLAPTASFFAPLMTTLVPTTAGNPTFTFARAALAYAMDFEGILRQSIANEARFQGARRVRNYLLATGNFSPTWWNLVANMMLTAGATDPDGGTTAYTITATAASATFKQVANGIPPSVDAPSIYIRRRTGSGAVQMFQSNNVPTDITSSVTSSWRRVTIPPSGGSTDHWFGIGLSVSGDAVDIWHPQLEAVDGQSNQAPSEYVSVGVLAAPYHGNGVDGVKWFATRNGNSVPGANLCLQSQTFGTLWAPQITTVQENTVAAPDGTITADTLAATTATNVHNIYQGLSIASGVTGTFSVYAKAASSNFVQLIWTELIGTNNWVSAVFNLSAGTVSQTGVGASSGTIVSTSITALPNGWYRCTITGSMTFAGSPYFLVGLAPAASGNTFDTKGQISYNGTTFPSSAYIWGAQAELGVVLNGYNPTTTAAVPAGNVVTEATGTPIPLATTLGYVAENAATNLCLQSQDFTTSYNGLNVVRTANTQAAPDGTLTADTFADNATSGIHSLAQPGIAGTNGQPYTFSIYAKQGTLPWLQLLFFDGVSKWANFNLATGAVGNKHASVTSASVALPNGWYRFSMSFTMGAASDQLQIISSLTDAAAAQPSYVGTGQTMYLWGAQVEQADPSSYIPTTTAAVTRAADSLMYQMVSNMDGALGTVYSEAYTVAANALWQYMVYLPGNGRSVQFYNQATHFLALTGSGTVQTANARVLGAVNKNVCAWGGATASVCLNGGAVATGAFTPYTNTGTLFIGGDSYLQGSIRNVNIYATRLTDAQLIALTT